MSMRPPLRPLSKAPNVPSATALKRRSVTTPRRNETAFRKSKLWLGFDPGGAEKFGVALLDGRGAKPAVQTAVVSCAAEALTWAKDSAGGIMPSAAGIDTLAFWSVGIAGWREADRWLRGHYREVQKSVQTPNGLYGSMLMQGMILALLLRQQWPEIKLTETHPKVLYFTRTRRRHRWEGESDMMRRWLEGELACAIQLANDHEFDALISAWAAREGFSGRWPRDLRTIPSSNQILEPAGAIHYWWPE